MDKPTIYLLRDIYKTYEVFRAIQQMDEDVLSGVDKAIRANYSEWLGGDWVDYKGENLQEDWAISVMHKDWTWDADGDMESLIWTFLRLEGDDPLWSFLGVNSSENQASIRIKLNFSSFGPSESNKYIKEFDAANGEFLSKHGFKRFGSVNRYYEKIVMFNPEYVINGIENDDWEDALKQIKDIYVNVVSNIEWGFLKRPLQKYCHFAVQLTPLICRLIDPLSP
jgi:hypothetical protein